MFTKVTEEDKIGKTNVGQSDTPGLNTSEMQILLDALPNLAIDKLNNLIDELTAVTAAGNIGATVPEGFTAQGNVQSILNNMIQTLRNCERDRHTHPNKETLDTISDEVKESYDKLVILLTGIAEIQTVLRTSNAAIPTSKAVADYCAGLNINTKAAKAAYPVGTTFSTTSTVDPSSILGFGRWTLVDTDPNGIRRYVRRE